MSTSFLLSKAQQHSVQKQNLETAITDHTDRSQLNVYTWLKVITSTLEPLYLRTI